MYLLELQELLNCIDELAKGTQETNWDLDRGRAISREEWDLALKFCIKVAEIAPDLPLPFVSPCGDGTIHFRWRNSNGSRFVVEMMKDKFRWSTRSSQGLRNQAESFDEKEIITLLCQYFDDEINILIDNSII